MDALALRAPFQAPTRAGARLNCAAPKFCRLGGVRARQDVHGAAPKALELEREGESAGVEISRRNLFSAVFAAATALPLMQKFDASATSFRQYNDRFDGYSFRYPEGWIQVRGAGADVFFRDPVNLDENVVVEFSSPSSSRYKSVEDLGTPEQAAEKVLNQYLTEFMSTRIGVRRESSIVSTTSRVGEDGRLYYDIEVNVKSFANTNQLAVMPQDRVAKLEWSRRYLSVIGVENNRLYELRLQTPERVLEQEGADLRQMMTSFKLVKLDA
ncbi:photosystem II oxygen-evolving enhancer protein 2 [Marchantia polymorpha subsp. ruderalis]|uniref:PsbP C-terminal domain-containing protein n=2 Tax=Marchantia polymorpha TaxID=3197 RepID=A0A176W5A0_MARPO|nr:hypothetical protein AXG93_1881s1140 [Marchantia polymorpha subsp. ruderalis]PTQ49643.1 hypothetical protein MARPO_0002s0119 [Marchantia polymorpha]BBN00241.1 hypothetical protein Mp_1g27590 [Marchantia polymorpha subsp. ruderalis]|eukprot:PTQ49643.1 hypothetical protein MARPO_0002s0119 [Marchantia polymorpha]